MKIDEANTDLESTGTPNSSPDDQKIEAAGGTRKRLSVRSSKFDRGNKGFLDDDEQLLVKYDVNGDGKIDASELFNIVSDLNKEHGKKKSLKKGLGISLAAIILLLTSSFGLVWAVVALTKEVVVDSSGHLVDSHTGKVVETKPEASLIHLTADDGMVRRLLQRKLSESIGGSEGGDGWVVNGREHLGTAPRNGVYGAYDAFQQNSEHCNVEVTADGVEYTRSLNLGGISRREENIDRRELQGGGGGGPPPKKRFFQGIYMDANPDQEFHVDCDDRESNCQVFSVGRFRPPPSGRRLDQIYGGQCSSDSDCETEDGADCKSIWGDRHCTCSEDSQCSYLLQSGGPLSSYSDYTNVRAECPSNYVCRIYYDCFSASMTTMTPEGPKRMDELKINDMVLTSSGKFQRVYAWLHRTPEELATSLSRESEYLQIVTEAGNKIEMTPKHMIYINDEEYPVEAGHVKVGDSLSLMEPGEVSTKLSKVTAINTVKLMGGFSPATEDGTIVVNGLVASSYNNPRYMETEYVEVAGKPLMHRQTFTHLVTSPLRLLCIHINGAFCEVDMDTEAFMPFSKGVDSLYLASVNAGIIDTVLTLTSFAGMFLHGIELFLKVFGLPLVGSACIVSLAKMVVPISFHMKVVGKSKKVD